jgi:hypothetical protein
MNSNLIEKEIDYTIAMERILSPKVAKKQMKQSEVIKRQEELLLEIEVLKLKNKRLEKLVADIQAVASKTIEALTDKETQIKTRGVLTIKKRMVNKKEVLAFAKKAYTKA